jgi:CHAD domain-containing protein
MQTVGHIARQSGILSEGANDAETAQLFLDTFDQRWKTYHVELENCRAQFSEAAVHDLRVSARRLLASLEMTRILDPHPRLQKVRRALKNLIDEFDELRDAQVMLANIADHIQAVPALAPLQKNLLRQEKSLLRAARKEIRNFDLQGLRKRIDKVRLRLESRLAQPETKTELVQAVDLAYATASQRYAQIDAAQPATIHRLRLAFKKFRYMMEIIHPILSGFPAEKLTAMHDYQSMMGEIQDAESFLHLLDLFREKKTSYDPQPARRFYERLHAERLAVYLENMGELITFWRATSQESFPWNQDKPGSIES